MEGRIYIQFLRHKENTCIGRRHHFGSVNPEVLQFLSRAQNCCRMVHTGRYRPLMTHFQEEIEKGIEENLKMLFSSRKSAGKVINNF